MRCPYCGSSDVERTADGFCCTYCGEPFDYNEQEEKVRDSINDLLDEMVGPLDDDARVEALRDILSIVDTMRAELEGGEE